MGAGERKEYPDAMAWHRLRAVSLSLTARLPVSRSLVNDLERDVVTWVLADEEFLHVIDCHVVIKGCLYDFYKPFAIEVRPDVCTLMPHYLFSFLYGQLSQMKR